jgi:hypothetical protein
MTGATWLLGLGWPGAGGGLPHALPTPFDGLVTGVLMLAFYAFGEWAHRRQIALRREKVVPFPAPPRYPSSS